MDADRTAFVMMPFASEFDDVYQSLIREPLILAGYQVIRGTTYSTKRISYRRSSGA